MFGDSFSVPFKRIENEHPYVPYKGYCPKIFSNILSEELNLNLVDMSNGGCSNYSILHTYIKNIDKIKSNDISPVIQRVDWESGIVYDAYTDEIDILSKDVKSLGFIPHPVKY